VPSNGSASAIDRFIAKDDGPAALITQIKELFEENTQRSVDTVN
jgi:hypothetical protein